MTLHVVQYSSGITSFCAALRVAEKYGTDNLVLLFADVLTEDPDNYRFLVDSSRYLGVPVTRVGDGRTPWQLFSDIRYLGNSRLAPCTFHLKIKPCRAWLTAHTDPDDTVLYVGLDSSARDRARAPGIAAGWKPWPVEFPMMQSPELSKQDQLAWCRTLGVEPPRMYAEGFEHANCFGMCVRAGQKQWRHLLAVAPERFAAAEAHEEQLRAMLGDVAILRERRAGISYPLPLWELRRRAAVGGLRPISGPRVDGSGCGVSHAQATPPAPADLATSALDV